MLYLVEVVRYGESELGVQMFGVFDLPLKDVIGQMKEYNSFRGGKYPAIYVTELPALNPKDLRNCGGRTRYDLVAQA